MLELGDRYDERRAEGDLAVFTAQDVPFPHHAAIEVFSEIGQRLVTTI